MQNRRILLGIAGGIAAYKTPQLVRDLRESGAEIVPVMTRSAARFVAETSLQAVSGQRVRSDLWDEEAEAAMGHIELARWADAVVVAPATAHVIARLATGMADDLLTTVCLATTAPIFLAPAMNRQMWEHRAVQRNLARLREDGVRILGPGEGDQACGETGPGRMLEPSQIVDALVCELATKPKSLDGLEVLLTAGPTREPIDPVRYISNHSSGKQGFALARAARDAGANVTLVSGPVALETPAGVRRIDVTTASEMYAAVEAALPETDIFIGVAAVADYRPEEARREKIKKTGEAEDRWLKLTENPDILARAAEVCPCAVGFAAETHDALRHAREKLARKGCAAIVLNDVSEQDIGFDSDRNAVTLIEPSGETVFPIDSKETVADKLIDAIASLFRRTSDSAGSGATRPRMIGIPGPIAPEIFRAYDIRGIVDGNLTGESVYWIGRAFAAQALAQDCDRVAVGGDGRHSTDRLREALASGLTDGGCNVIDVGCVPTPLLYYATYALETGTGIMITGSHNPAEYNGLKMVLDGRVLSGNAIGRLRSRIERGDFPAGAAGAAESADVIESYMERVIGDIRLARTLKVVLDSGNGVGGLVAPRLFENLGCDVMSLYADVDGSFPNHHPDPADARNLDDLINAVGENGADLGLAFDGDADRLGVVTDSGKIIWPDRLMMLFARDIARRNPGTDIVYDVKCSRYLGQVVAEAGGNPIMSRTGHSHIKAKIRETGALFGGEFSGHLCFGERWYGFDDAIYAGARLLEIAASNDCGMDALFADFPVPCTTPEIKLPTTESAKFRIIEELSKSADFGPGKVTRIDGLRVDYADGFGLVRASNTSPALTLRFEADDASALDRIRSAFGAQLSAIDPALTF